MNNNSSKFLTVSGKSIDFLSKELIGNVVEFKSDCEFFPNFHVICRVKSISQRHNELIFDVIVIKNRKKLTIGSNMKNLVYRPVAGLS